MRTATTTTQTTQLEYTYAKVIESLGFLGAKYKNERAKIHRALKKVAGNGHVPPFVWLDHKGNQYLPEQMATLHLFYAIRMIWNHTVPEYFRIPNTKKYSDVPHWSIAYRTEALKALRSELDSRPFQDLDTEQLKQLSYMSVADKAIEDIDAEVRAVLTN